MSIEKRKFLRRAIRCAPQIASAEGIFICDCTLADISVSGMRLKVRRPMEVPEFFSLSLTRGRAVWRKCTVVWRSKTEIGARFADR
jgi:hypothetical protein